MELVIAQELRLPFAFSVVLVGRVFKSGSHKLLFGTTDGKVRIYQNGQEERLLETKGGSVQQMLLCPILHLNSTELIVGDAAGNVVIFFNGEILNKASLCGAVTSLVVDTDMGGRSLIVAGDQANMVTAFEPHNKAWSLRLCDAPIRVPKPLLSSLLLGHRIPPCTLTASQGPSPPAIRAMLSATVNDTSGVPSHYLLLADGRPYLHFYNGLQRNHLAEVPSRINAMCAGRFSGGEVQVVVGCENGCLYVLDDRFQLVRYASAGSAVVQLHAFRLQRQPPCDALICVTQSPILRVYIDRKLVLEYEFAAWVQTVAVGDADNDRQDEVVVALVDGSVLVCKLAEKGAAAAT